MSRLISLRRRPQMRITVGTRKRSSPFEMLHHFMVVGIAGVRPLASGKSWPSGSQQLMPHPVIGERLRLL